MLIVVSKLEDYEINITNVVPPTHTKKKKKKKTFLEFFHPKKLRSSLVRLLICNSICRGERTHEKKVVKVARCRIANLDFEAATY